MRSSEKRRRYRHVLCRPCKGGESPGLEGRAGIRRDVRGYLEMASPRIQTATKIKRNDAADRNVFGMEETPVFYFSAKKWYNICVHCVL